MIYDLNEIANLPDTFSLEDLRVVCHISKRTARYYLRAGLIPCEISEKKTHCYTIRKEDLLEARMDKASTPLTNEALQVQQVARLCGFTSLPHFSRAFRARYHCAPSEYASLRTRTP